MSRHRRRRRSALRVPHLVAGAMAGVAGLLGWYVTPIVMELSATPQAPVAAPADQPTSTHLDEPLRENQPTSAPHTTPPTDVKRNESSYTRVSEAPTHPRPTSAPPKPKTTPAPKAQPKPQPKATTPAPQPQPKPVDTGKGGSMSARWGKPTGGDEFNYSGRPSSQLWSMYDGEGHAGNGRRTPEAFSVGGGVLTLSGDRNGNSGGMAAKFDRSRYGRWEARVRSSSSGTGHQYHPVLLIWPDSGSRQANGEYDWMENGAPGERCIEAYMHYPGETPKKQDHFEDCNVPGGLSAWHNVAFEWTSAGLTGYIDGRQWFHTNNADIAGMPSGHLCIQLDAFDGSSGYAPAQLQVDWVRYWAVSN